MIKINLTTQTLSREPLPEFLEGLAAHDLKDLSWLDPALGLSGFGFLPERDITPPLAEEEEYSGEETLTLNEAGELVEVLRGTRPKSAQTLEAERKARTPEIITKLQCMKQLKKVGKWEAFKALLESNPDANDEWALSDNVNRHYPLTQSMGQALGLSEEEMDDLFIEALKHV